MTRLGRWLVLGMVTVGGAALAQGATASDTGEQEQVGKGGSGTMTMLGNLPQPKDEQDLVNRLNHLYQMEAQLAQLVEQKNVSPDVKKYAQTVVKDNQAASQKLTDWAKRKNLTVGEVQAANDVEQKKMKKDEDTLDLLQSLDGVPFEQQYLATQVLHHDFALDLLMSTEQQFAKSDIAPLLKGLTPTIREHRNRAYRLLGEPRGGMRQARTPAGR